MFAIFILSYLKLLSIVIVVGEIFAIFLLIHIVGPLYLKLLYEQRYRCVWPIVATRSRD